MENEGLNKLAALLDGRVSQHAARPRVLDFGTIKGNALVTDSFPVTIPTGEFTICKSIAANVVPGARVLVAWVGAEATVIDTI